MAGRFWVGRLNEMPSPAAKDVLFLKGRDTGKAGESPVFQAWAIKVQRLFLMT